MAKELLDIANLNYFLRFRVVWRLGCVINTFARFARFARTLPTPTLSQRSATANLHDLHAKLRLYLDGFKKSLMFNERGHVTLGNTPS
jgi:hypothetical protein